MSFHKIRALDSKYSIALDDDDGRPVIIKTQTGIPIPDDEPVFVLRGKDGLVPPTLQHYATLLSVARLASGNAHFADMADEVLEHAKFMETWLANQPSGTRLPD